MKTLRSAALVAALTLAFAAPSFALDLPTHSDKDHRVRYVQYDPANVIQIDAVIGVATHIQLEPGEEYVYHVFGDSEAYDFTHKLNHIFFKPVVDQADTNLTVITNRREYTFRISYFDDRNSKALYKLVMQYPDTAAAEMAEEWEKRSVDAAWKEGQAVAYNWQTYMKSGALGLAPVHAWDDGRHTFMQFAPHAELPAIYYVDGDGQESIANYHMQDSDTVVLHRTAARWHLRIGNQVVAIHNQGFGQIPRPSDTGTISSQVARVVDGEPVQRPRVAVQNLQTYPLNPPKSEVSQPATSMGMKEMSDQPVISPSPKPELSANASSATAIPGTEVAPLAAIPQPVISNAASPAAQPQPATSNPASTKQEVSGYRARSGDSGLMPRSVTNKDGHTKFQFASPDIPAIAPLDESGNERFVGMHVEPENSIVVHAESDAWRLKKGGASLVLERDK